MRKQYIVGMLLLVLAVVLPVPAAPAETQKTDAERVVMARATWSTSWFQAAINRLLLQRLGYHVVGPVTMGNEAFYNAVAKGKVDLWVNGWFPLHASLIEPDDPVEVVGVQVKNGALQGYFVDAATAHKYGITNLGDLADPDIAELFDRDGDGKADLIGCPPQWSCSELIEFHLAEYGLEDTVEQIQGNYTALMMETIERYNAGKPVLFYTWTPNWTLGKLEPGEDVVWLETPYPALPPGRDAAEDRTTVADIPGCADNPCQIGFPPNDIRAVVNSRFLAAHPAVGRLLEQVRIPLEDILAQNARMVDGQGTLSDIRNAARAWIDAHESLVDKWLAIAAPGTDTSTEAGTAAPADNQPDGGVLRVVTRPFAPFVMFENGTYTGFAVELARLLADQMDMEVEFYMVNTLARQINDVARGAADIAIGGVQITQARETRIDFTVATLDTGLTILVSPEARQGVIDRILGFFHTVATSELPWLVLFFALMVLIAAHIVWWYERRHNPNFAESYGQGISESIYWAVVTMSTVGYGDKVVMSHVGRALTILWITIGTLVFAAFTAAIAAALAVDELRGDINGPGDLPHVTVATVQGSAGQQYLSSEGIGPVLVDEVEQAYELLANGEVKAVVFDAPVLRYYAIQGDSSAVTTVGPTFEDVKYGVAVGEGNNKLRENINLALLRLMEKGLYERLRKEWFGSSSG